ncbi:fimbrial protein [Photorhabdus khanii]|uniref:Fimbrial-type adhesion domain-containing protein n=1 Tax=Photorhabdus khanii subsp. guanajuatensis TaxID=2100166 RepID=A0A4R4JI00_9GAMM|nr:fimbrial protein [Photorhabdus khanii]TDB53678.1 hypothetical protein C5467_14640 [Photorhabdus khanii subsp. guanajuatensis]
MRKNFIWVSLAMVLGIFTSFNALSYDGVIKFRGTIEHTTCTVKGTGSSNKEILVNFNDIRIPTLSKSSGSSLLLEKKDISIGLTGCPDHNNINVKFKAGTTDNNSTNGHPDYFPTTLKNVAIALYNKDDDKIIKPNNSIKINKRATSINLTADLVSTANLVTAGTFASNVEFDIIYN